VWYFTTFWASAAAARMRSRKIGLVLKRMNAPL
jgi:hypothetical protein